MSIRPSCVQPGPPPGKPLEQVDRTCAEGFVVGCASIPDAEIITAASTKVVANSRVIIVSPMEISPQSVPVDLSD